MAKPGPSAPKGGESPLHEMTKINLDNVKRYPTTLTGSGRHVWGEGEGEAPKDKNTNKKGKSKTKDDGNVSDLEVDDDYDGDSVGTAEVEDEVSEEVQEEEPAAPEPEDPAKIQAALEAAREKKRQQDAESRRLRSRQQEKKGNPKYQEMMDRRSTLPAFLMRDTILEAIDKHSVVVISGDTGASQCLSFLCVHY